ncbi:hypothetical protein LINPERHAP1_LOCUS10480 [Linum perenne]
MLLFRNQTILALSQVRPRNNLSELFHHDQDGEFYAKAKAIVSELEMRGDEIRVFNEIVTPDVDDFTEENGELKPMKEFIDLECHRQKTNPDKDYEIRPATADGDDLDSPFDKHFKEIAGRFWEAASIFSKKLGEMESEAEEEERGVTAAATGAKRRRNLGNDGSH